MKVLRTFLLAALAAACALAQTTGSITIQGTGPDSASITNTSDAALSSTVALGALTPQTGGALTASTVAVRLRSNKAYKLSAQTTPLSVTGGAQDGGATITLSDIGFGITAIDASGTNVATGHSDTIASTPASFDYRSGYPPATNGLTPFVAGTNATLNDITSNTEVLNGSRISAKGNLSTNNNFVLVTFGVATLPQYFTPATAFSTTVTLTIATL